LPFFFFQFQEGKGTDILLGNKKIVQLCQWPQTVLQICYANVRICRQIAAQITQFSHPPGSIPASRHIGTFIHYFTTALTKNKRYLQSNIITGYQISTETTMLRPD
jgi:hypothetical protein